MCAAACPAQCISIEAGEYPVDADRQSAVIEKYPTQFIIDELRCVVCGFCVEACPKDAIRMDTGTHMPAQAHRAEMVLDIPKLLKGPQVSHSSDPWLGPEGSAAAREPKEVHLGIGEGAGRDSRAA
jgi:NADH-quinone oxidoreductase subunit I